MADPDETAARLADDLAPFGDVTVKAMFGGRGVFVDGTMTALVDRGGAPFVRGDDGVAADLEAAGAARHGKMPYWRVPDDVWDDPDAMATWAARADATARANA